jgi:hypothetical protein
MAEALASATFWQTGDPTYYGMAAAFLAYVIARRRR